MLFMDKNDIEQFSYNENDFHFIIEDDNNDSKFDKILKEKWNTLENNNVLRYSVKHSQFKLVEGNYKFYVQLNSKRGTERRKPEKIVSMLQEFDSSRFNFTKIHNKEILLDIGGGDSNDVIAVNDSPILWSHCLLVVQRFNNLPQQVTLYSFKKAIEILLLSNSQNMRVLLNSLCANASVNHLHWHLYYLDQRMLLETIPLQHLASSVYTLEDYPAKGFCIKFSSFDNQDINKFACYAYKVVSCLLSKQIAHNIYITRAKTDVNEKKFDDIRIYIWARKYSNARRNDFNIAACELFGHVPIMDEEAYANVNERYISECLENLTATEFLNAKEKIKELLQENAN